MGVRSIIVTESRGEEEADGAEAKGENRNENIDRYNKQLENNKPEEKYRKIARGMERKTENYLGRQDT